MERMLVFIFSLCLISLQLRAQSETIVWQKGQKLNWSDFKGTPEGKIYEAARSEFKVEFKYSGSSDNGELVFQFDVSALFIPKASWYVADKVSNELLMHEQLHFDITELYARKMRQRFQTAPISKENYKADIKAIYGKVMDELKAYRKQYNNDTLFGANLNKQLQWNSKVHKEMGDLEKFVK
ncbi:MAG: DUF922 domain-containing protein [Bacteroidota bacterium]